MDDLIYQFIFVFILGASCIARGSFVAQGSEALSLMNPGDESTLLMAPGDEGTLFMAPGGEGTRVLTQRREPSRLVSVRRMGNDQLYLNAPCDKIKQIQYSLFLWKQKTEKWVTPSTANRNEPKNSFQQDGDDFSNQDLTYSRVQFCQKNISQIVPDFVLERHDKSTIHDGPNCFNTALNSVGLLQSIRHSTQEEIDFFTRPPFCREIKVKSDLEPGDLILIRGSGVPSEMHAFIYINDDLVFSKSRFSIQFPYELVSSEWVFSIFALGKIAKPECRLANDISKSDCPVRAQYYRCQNYEESLKEELKNRNEKSMQQLRNLFFESKVQIENLNEKLSAVIMGQAWTYEIKLVFSIEIKRLSEKLDLILKDTHLDSNKIWFQSLRVQLSSIESQIEMLDRGW